MTVTVNRLELTEFDISGFAIDISGDAIAFDQGAQWLCRVDLTDSSTTSIGYLTGIYNAIEYGPDGELYAWEHTGGLYRIDVDNLEAIYLKNFSVAGTSMAFIPEPTTLLLLGLGGFMLRKR